MKQKPREAFVESERLAEGTTVRLARLSIFRDRWRPLAVILPFSRMDVPLMNQEDLEQKYFELCYYTLAHPDPSFIHQHVVDAYSAQCANESTKPITLAFALIGLFLYLEKNYSGKEVQQAHMQLANRRKQWPKFVQPESRGEVTVVDVVAVSPGKGRDEMIRKWCVSIWGAYRESHQEVASIVQTELRRVRERN